MPKGKAKWTCTLSAGDKKCLMRIVSTKPDISVNTFIKKIILFIQLKKSLLDLHYMRIFLHIHVW
jgi:hypothetical protein